MIKYIFKQKCPASQKTFSTLSPQSGLLLHEFLHRCGVARRRSACGSTKVLEARVTSIAATRLSSLLVSLIFPLDNTNKLLYGASVAAWSYDQFWYLWQCGSVPTPAGKLHQCLLKPGQKKEVLFIHLGSLNLCKVSLRCQIWVVCSPLV